MTLVAAVALDGYPVIFGDLLVSATGRRSVARDIPSEDSLTADNAGSQWPIPDLDQKVVLVSNHCVVAWTGSVASARAMVGELRAMASKAALSISSIETYLAQLGPGNDEFSLVGWIRDGEVFHQFWYRADIAKSAMFGQISAAGSGASEFVDVASQIAAGPVDARGDAPLGLERAVAAMLSATSLLLRAELSGKSDPLQHFGDGYEIATFIGDRFAKLGDIGFVSWKADIADGQVTLSGPEFILKQDYAGEYLLLHALRMRPGGAAGAPSVIEEAKRVISPLVDTIDVERAAGIAWPGMEATFTCHVVFVRSPKGFDVVNQIEYSESRMPGSIRFSLDDGRTPFGVSQQFCEALMKSIHAGFAGV